MADSTERPRPGGDPRQNNSEDNQAQSQSDAPRDEIGRGPDFTEQSDRAHGTGSDANGVPEFDEVDGENRKRLYKDGATLVSRID